MVPRDAQTALPQIAPAADDPSGNKTRKTPGRKTAASAPTGRDAAGAASKRPPRTTRNQNRTERDVSSDPAEVALLTNIVYDEDAAVPQASGPANRTESKQDNAGRFPRSR